MPDAQILPDTQILLSAFRGEIADLERRRVDLRGQLEVIDREHARLATTVSVLEERVGMESQSGSPDTEDEVPLADRIVGALGRAGLRRPDLLRLFTAQGFTPSAIDSAVNRLKKRGSVRRQGRRILRSSASSGFAEPTQPASTDAGGLDPAAPSSGSETAGRGSGDRDPAAAVPASVSPDPVAAEVVDDDDDRPLTQRVRDAVATGIDTRKKLLQYFARRGVKESSVDDAVSGLRKRGVLARLPRGQLAVAVKRESSAPSGSESQPS